MGKLRDFIGSSPDLGLRTFSSIFIVAAIIGGIYFGGLVWSVVVSVIALLSLWEFRKLQSAYLDSSPILVMLAGLFILGGTAYGLITPMIVICTVSAVAFISLFIEVVKHQRTGESDALVTIGADVAGIAYIVMPWTFLMLIRSNEHGTFFLAALFICTWGCDVAAYFVGSHLGRHLLCSRVSPHKTWEGFIGGAAASLLCGAALSALFVLPPMPLVLLGLLCGIAGQLGDLGESVLKREAGVKDSGHLIPGHGGLLDRFDSILVNGTIAFIIFQLI